MKTNFIAEENLKSYCKISIITIKVQVFDAQSSSDNAQIACGGADRAVTVFDVETGKQLRRWRGHGGKHIKLNPNRHFSPHF